MTRNYEKLFEHTYSLFTETIMLNEIRKALHNSAFDKTYQQHTFFWGGVIAAIDKATLLNLSKLYEDSGYVESGQTLSVFYLKERQTDQVRRKDANRLLSKHRLKISKLKRLRDKRLFHTDIDELIPIVVRKNIGALKNFEADDLLEIAADLLSALHPNPSHGYSFSVVVDGCIREVKDIIRRLKYVQKLQKNQRAEFLAGKSTKIQLDY